MFYQASRRASRPCRALAAGLLILGAAGCGGASYDRYLPPEADARAALDAALAAWRDGQPYGTVRKGSLVVEVVDAQWRDGSKLKGFEIVGAEPGNGPQQFAVRLSAPEAAAARDVRYVVAGRGPFWVYREEEFKRLSGM